MPSIPACIMTLILVYPVFLGAGIWFFIYMQKKNPHPVPERDPRYRLVKPLRFSLFVLLSPLAATLSLVVIGWLDPLFYMLVAFKN